MTYDHTYRPLTTTKKTKKASYPSFLCLQLKIVKGYVVEQHKCQLLAGQSNESFCTELLVAGGQGNARLPVPLPMSLSASPEGDSTYLPMTPA